MGVGLPLQLGVLIFTVLAFVMLLLIPSLVAGLLVSIVTVPLLSLTGYGFTPLHRAPAYGADSRESALWHVAGGTLTFGLAMLGSLLSSHLLPNGVHLPMIGLVNGGLLVTVVALTVALVITLFVSKPDGEHVSTPRQVFAIVGIWYGYPILLGGVFVIALNLAGIGTYHPPEWVPWSIRPRVVLYLPQ